MDILMLVAFCVTLWNPVVLPVFWGRVSRIEQFAACVQGYEKSVCGMRPSLRLKKMSEWGCFFHWGKGGQTQKTNQLTNSSRPVWTWCRYLLFQTYFLLFNLCTKIMVVLCLVPIKPTFQTILSLCFKVRSALCRFLFSVVLASIRLFTEINCM